MIRIAAALAASLLLAISSLAATSPALRAEPASANDTARFLAGMPPSAGSPLARLAQDGFWKSHAGAFNATFGNVDQRQLAKVRKWSSANVTVRRPVLFYLFSGPDFMYASAFFPNASTYVLAGLEPVGSIPDLTKMSHGQVAGLLGNLRGSLRSVLSISFFLTNSMRHDMRAGTVPSLYVFLARSGKTIRDVTLVNLDDQGQVRIGDGLAVKSAARGVKIAFTDSQGREGTLYYFSTNLANNGFRASGFEKFLASLGEGMAYVKSASYLMHAGNFSNVRDFLLNNTAVIVQDDTGIPVGYFDQKQWQLKPYGNYVGPIPLFAGRYQAKLRELHRVKHAPPIDFGVGYRHGPNQSSLLLAIKNEAAAKP